MARNMSTWVAVGLMLAARPAEGDLNCWRGVAAVTLEGECGSSPSKDGTASQDGTKRAHKWWRGEARTHFGISKQQSSELEAIFQQTLPVLRAKKADVDREEKVLSRLLAEANTTNESAVVQAVERVEAMRRSLSRTFTMMQYYMYRRLTPQQLVKVHAYHEHSAQGSAPATPPL